MQLLSAGFGNIEVFDKTFSNLIGKKPKGKQRHLPATKKYKINFFDKFLELILLVSENTYVRGVDSTCLNYRFFINFVKTSSVPKYFERIN